MPAQPPLTFRRFCSRSKRSAKRSTNTYTSPPPPRQVRPDLPPVLEEIILRCLAKRPADRYATGTQLARALQTAIGTVGLAPILCRASATSVPPASKATVLITEVPASIHRMT